MGIPLVKLIRMSRCAQRRRWTGFSAGLTFLCKPIHYACRLRAPSRDGLLGVKLQSVKQGSLKEPDTYLGAQISAFLIDGTRDAERRHTRSIQDNQYPVLVLGTIFQI